MRALALFPVLALTLAACGDKPGASSGAEPADAARAGDASSLSFDAAGLPRFKPGLWEVRSTDDGKPDNYQICMGEEANEEIREAVTGASEGCTRNVSRAGGALSLSVACELGGARNETSYVIKGSDTRSSTSMRMTIKDLSTNNVLTEMVSKSDGRWIGACPAGLEPGERVDGK